MATNDKPSVAELVKQAKAAASAATKLVEAERALAVRVEELKLERQRLRAAGPSKAEALASIDALVDAHAQKWAEEHAGRFVNALGGGSEWQDTREISRPPRLPRWGDLDKGMTAADWFGLHPDAAKVALRRVVNAAQKSGPTAAEKAKRLAELDAEIESTERQRVEVLDAVAAAGIDTEAIRKLRAEERGRELAAGTPYINRGFGSLPA